MTSTFFGLEIGRRGIMSQRIGMDTTAHNLANASTEGYTRQEAVFAATSPYPIPTWDQIVVPGQLGTGVEVSNIRRIRDDLLDVQVRNAQGEAGFWEEREVVLSQVEAIFPEPTEYGLQSLIGEFFDNWHELNTNPQDVGLKSVVKMGAEGLTAAVRQTNRQLRDNESSLRDGIEARVGDINTITNEINDLNSRIKLLVGAGAQPNDLMDRRDLLLDKLGTYGAIEVEHQATGVVKVSLFGQELVGEDGVANAVSIQAPFAASGNSFVLVYSSGATVNMTAAANAYSMTGSLVGIESARQRIIGYMNDLDTLADVIRDQVNAAHGYSAGPPASGVPIFDPDSTGAIDFDLSTEVKTDANNIDGTIALTVAGLRDDLVLESGTASFESYYQQLVTRIGQDMQGSSGRTDGAQAVRDQLLQLRESVSGVSLDEELTKLTQYQYAFQASSRVVTMVDNFLDVLINRMAV